MITKPDIAFASARILVVDDEHHNRDLLRVMLEPEGFVVLSASSGQEALTMVAQQAPDLILLDIRMADLDGYHVAAKIKGNSATKNIPIIMITALGDRDAKLTGLSAGAEEFLTKPVDRVELCMRVRNLLRLRAYGDYYDKYSQILEAEVTSRTADLVERTKALELQSDQLEEAGEQLRQSQKMEAIGSLAGGIAHDFNNLLTAIIGFSEMALTRLDDKEGLRQDIEEILRAGERASALTRQLLVFSRQQVLQTHPISLNALVTELAKLLRRLIAEDIDLSISCGEPPATILADPGQIEQVIVNLAVNASDAMPEGGQLVIETSNVEIDLTYAGLRPGLKPGPYVMLAVTDNGAGMDAATQARVFEPFFTTKEIGKGTGLGLAAVYGIVKQCEGDIHVYSEKGEGTTFKILFPRVAEPAALPHAAARKAAIGRGTETILVVEDEEAVRSLIRDSLSLHGYVVHEARDGLEALKVQATVEGPIHLIVCDMVMPLMSGPEVVTRLGEPRPESKVLFMSGYAEKALLRRGLSQGAEFLHKPFGMETLARKVRKVLDGPVPQDREAGII